MNFIIPSAEELSYLRADPLLWEQELDVRPEVAEAIEKAVGFRAGRVYWRSEHDHIYGLELADLGRGRPSMAMVYGHWDRYEPRPPEHEIDADLMDFILWVAEVAPTLNPSDVSRVAQFAGVRPTWPEGSVLRTPEDRFANLPGFPYEPRYVEVEGLRMAFVEQGEGDPILMLHGEPTGGYLYRHMIPPLAEAGRVIVPDLVGFGRSDKPVADHAYSYKSHVRWMRRFIMALGLQRVTLVGQDWGGAIGLRILAQMPERFRRLVAMNTGIGGGFKLGEGFMGWRIFSQRARELDLPRMMKRFETAGVELRGCRKTLAIYPDITEVKEEDFYREYLDLILNVKVVEDMDEAMEHIAKYGSAHSDAIVTINHERAMRFLREVDSSAVFVNASTRLNDGFQFGLGAEIGISTDKIHARGPMGLEELTCTKFIVLGNGQLRE